MDKDLLTYLAVNPLINPTISLAGPKVAKRQLTANSRKCGAAVCAFLPDSSSFVFAT